MSFLIRMSKNLAGLREAGWLLGY
ncbi:hypothetical protein dqs_0675 [Azoarcus olearius]|nr:hypothetical protein dqs_0675 [Azoarcus olearius]